MLRFPFSLKIKLSATLAKPIFCHKYLEKLPTGMYLDSAQGAARKITKPATAIMKRCWRRSKICVDNAEEKIMYFL